MTAPPAPLRLGIYADLVYRSVDGRLSADLPFAHVIVAMAPRVKELVVFGRFDPTPTPFPHTVSSDNLRYVPLPHYPRVTHVSRVAHTSREAMRLFAAELADLDAVWLFGPHPIALAFAGVAIRRRTSVVLGIRQDYTRYIARRLPNAAWVWAIPVAYALERSFRLLARRVPTVVVGDDLACKYRGGGAPLLTTGFSLVAPTDIVSLDDALARSWDGPLRLLSVGRLDPEKNPLLLPKIMLRLREHDPRWQLTVAGDGQLAEALAQHAVALGVEDAITRLGHVPPGPDLMSLYRANNAFLHVSWTEGVPQVLFEAQAAGLPIVATDVGGVRATLAQGEAGILIPPNDVNSAVFALERLRTDEQLRRRLIQRGLEHVGQATIDAQLDRVLAFLEDSIRCRSDC